MSGKHTKQKIMHLVNFPKVRVKKYPQGYAVEIQRKNWWGKKCWKHIVSTAGLPNNPWYFKTEDMALEEASRLFKCHLYFYSELS